MIPDSSCLRQDHAADWVANRLTKIPPPIHIESKGSPTRNRKSSHPLHLYDSCVFQGTMIKDFSALSRSIPSIFSRESSRTAPVRCRPGWVAEIGSDASIDSSLPRSTLASSSSGCFFTLSSSSRSGAPAAPAGELPSGFFSAFCVGHGGRSLTFGFTIQNERRRRAFRVNRQPICSTDRPASSANGRACNCGFPAKMSLMTAANVRSSPIFAAGPLCRLARSRPNRSSASGPSISSPCCCAACSGPKPLSAIGYRG